MSGKLGYLNLTHLNKHCRLCALNSIKSLKKSSICTDHFLFPLVQVSFNPLDSTQVCVSGSSVFKLFRYVDGALKQTNSAKLESQNVLSHAWMSEERIIAGTETGRLLVFESGELRWEMSVTNKIAEQEKKRWRIKMSCSLY